MSVMSSALTGAEEDPLDLVPFFMIRLRLEPGRNDAPLSPADAQDLIVDRCSSCNGFWLDSGELDRIVDIAGNVDAELLSKATVYQRPPDWSWLKWMVYKYKTFK